MYINYAAMVAICASINKPLYYGIINMHYIIIRIFSVVIVTKQNKKKFELRGFLDYKIFYYDDYLYKLL